MRLTKIKLAGFKSFVDPTTLIVPGNLVGIVGPNGCGKSNIIDAVIWVMGESSAKHLRGDSLADVIFNGSSARQPVSQSSVELVFDNSDGRLGGQYASYSEISIKRQMNRDGVSSYFLNGSRCRRRDIQAIFLGTGLGPRSYSIIEQGVISRLVEAKPEELRTFIEEAAGISKYRERRRETENRIRHTRENIERLNDIREELGKQLSHLKRQARAAERYQVLKQEERQLRAEIMSLDWQEHKLELGRKEEHVRSEESRVEAGVARLRHVEAEIEKQREELAQGNDALNQRQSEFYQIGAEISQLEQKIQHGRERTTALETDLASATDALTEIKAQQENDRSSLQDLERQAGSLEPQLHGSRSDSNQAYDSLNQAEQAMQGWQTEWDACVEAAANFTRQIDVDMNRLQHLQDGYEEYRLRQTAGTRELEDIDLDAMTGQLNDLTRQLEEQNDSIRDGRTRLENKQENIRRLRTLIREIQEQLGAQRAEHQKLTGEIVSLQALQQHAAGTDQEAVVAWLAAARLDQAPRLVQQMNIEPDWTVALETVLGARLQDICVADIEPTLISVADLERGNIGIITAAGTDNNGDYSGKYERLQDKVSSGLSLHELLRGVYAAPDLDSALEIRRDLQGNESVVTRDGIWLGRHWIRINKQDELQKGILARELLIQQLMEQEGAIAHEIHALETRLETANADLELEEQAAESCQNELHPGQEDLARLHSSHAELKTRMEQLVKRRAQLEEELENIETQATGDEQEIESIRQRLDRTQADKQALEDQRTRLNTLRDHHRGTLNDARSQWQTTHEQSHEIALQLESLSSRKASCDQAIQRTGIQIANLESRIVELQGEITAARSPLKEYSQSLETKLDGRTRAEKLLSQARNQVQLIDSALREKEQQRAETEQQTQELREQLERARLAAQEIRVRLQTVAEQLQTAGHNPEQLLENMDDSAVKSTWEEQLAVVERKVHRLGPINLAAIDEFNQLSERKTYLDRQYEDLNDALTTLDNAIRKIDRETRTRFKETFDELNTNLKEMFPVLFGGGHAYLELTGDDLLQTGVTIMAQPPGKRNSTIHLLSGGEKALTAVALVFAIFRLNPAPFCILDEVDAPLDDNNVARFSELVTRMSTDVQFIFITHNKITMEIAQQLLGVTMHEAGVSRLVSVDMDEAVQMAASA